MAVGSTEYYNSIYGNQSLTANVGTKDEAWNFDYYFRSPISRNSAKKMTMTTSLTGAITITIWSDGGYIFGMLA